MKRVRRHLRLRDVARDLDEELAFHFESVVEDLMRKGRTRAQAEGEARRRFGDEARYRRELTRIDRGSESRRRWSQRADAVLQTSRFAWRSIVRSPGLSVGIILAFALGIGANATVFGIADRLLLSPPAHIGEPDGVRRVLVDRFLGFAGRRIQSGALAYPDYTDFRDVPAFVEVGGYSGRQRLTVGRGQAARPVDAVHVTASFWEVLRARPTIGRFFDESEDRIGGTPSVVLGWNLWQSMFGGAPSALGETVDLGHGRFTIVGVAPKGFTGVGLEETDLWLPAHVSWPMLNGAQWFEGRGGYWLSVVARLAPGATGDLAETQATTVHRAGRAGEIERGAYDADVRVLVTPLIAARGPNAPAEARVATWLAGVSAIVLLIACVNVTNLLLARGLRQRREVGIRLALGVSRRRLIGQTLAGGLMLALLGGGAALLVARWGGSILRSMLLPNVAWVDQGLGLRTIVFALGMALLAGLAATLMPAIAAAREDVSTTLRDTSGGITSSRQRTRAALTIAQAALSVVLLVGAGLFVRSLQNVQSLDLGFDPEPLLFVRLVEDTDAFTAEERLLFYRDAAARLMALPGVVSASYTRGMPFYTGYADYLRAEGVDSIAAYPTGGPYIHAVGPDYLRTMATRVLRGRGFDERDRPGAEPVALVNEGMARHVWPDGEALGRCLYLGRDATDCTRIVGVLQDVRRGSITEPPGQPQYYVPIEQEAARRGAERARPEAMIVRVAGDASAQVGATRQSLLGMDPRVRFAHVTPLTEQLVDPQLRSWRLGATMFSIFGALALVVAGLGLYSVLAFDVAQRTRELGLRSALGADTRALLGMIVNRAARLVLVGVAAGLAVAVLLAPRLQDLLYETSPRDPVTLGLVALVLLAAAGLASCVPAWRASRVDPIVALKSD